MNKFDEYLTSVGVLKSTAPAELKQEWYETKLSKRHRGNVKLMSEYTLSRDNGSFKCEVCGHEWEYIMTGVMHGNMGCPQCSSRNSPPEARVLDRTEGRYELISSYTKASDHHLFKCTACGHEIEHIYCDIARNRCRNCRGLPDVNYRHRHTPIIKSNPVKKIHTKSQLADINKLLRSIL